MNQDRFDALHRRLKHTESQGMAHMATIHAAALYDTTWLTVGADYLWPCGCKGAYLGPADKPHMVRSLLTFDCCGDGTQGSSAVGREKVCCLDVAERPPKRIHEVIDE